MNETIPTPATLVNEFISEMTRDFRDRGNTSIKAQRAGKVLAANYVDRYASADLDEDNGQVEAQALADFSTTANAFVYLAQNGALILDAQTVNALHILLYTLADLNAPTGTVDQIRTLHSAVGDYITKLATL